MRLNGKLLPFLAAAAIGLLLIGTNASGLVEAKAASAGVSASVATQRVKLGLNKSVVIDLPNDAYDILVANPAVADAVTRTARRIYLFGKAVGETNIFVFGPNGEQIVSLDLAVERDVAGLEDYLKRFIPSSQIKVELLNDNVVLTGTVDTPLDAKRAVDLATIFVSGGEATTGQYSQTAAGGSVNGGVDINNPDQERRVSKIVNLLQIIGDDQVTLKVTVAEVSRSVMKQLGVNMLASGGSNGISWAALSDPYTGLGKPLSNAGLSTSSSGLQSYINAMEQSGVMKTLAEPTLTAVSGEKATFKVGGEYNIVKSVSANVSTDNQTGLKNYSVDKIEYGIGLEFQPVVLSPGRISLKVRTSVSEPTTEGSVSASTDNQSIGMNALSLRKRLADTTVELPSGGSMMIAGLVRDDLRQAVTGLPGLTKIPVLGTLFRSRDFVRNESELVIIITPYLARPVARNDLAKPDDNFNAASDGAGMFLGRVNRVYGTMQTDRPPGRYHGVVGFIYK
ncbi:MULTISPECIES: type II and III secretion system protein family protein [unclassified Mesorhizobium]|jgi:pilus assembly protein CpaC|uniref:type II and III secretion system protein family protein n=1 Tax=unclassified Mesorhizobium TaxID=325217 RepID=UPI000FDA01A9|nr:MULTISPECIES: type II and III secretion system protein family protein [unclassified Mesorhizobium]TGQ05542.1 type II and III secretion system protein family protein [Mesorhizobium sp. M2E.F.Ca.ET.219.01.1.1]TGS11014.1 type II and III secretion system protein family protein [Mesorhizobium sp. M2E.F.Ca.ET.209.01.1.1]TGT72178.1 type II and III secretion system protein family protein [Mesorhizobium sp. M2E.F.Ca.ET.166.01.1.1]TGV99108.1 type II and III secretion system protein family protein [Mes